MDELNKPEAGDGLFFVGLDQQVEPYPAWRYHDFMEPVIVNNTEEDLNIQAQGWKTLDAPITAVPHLSNWRHDLEDMTAKQLVLFAKEEFGVDLPVEAGEVKLVKAMWQLTHIAPQHSGRICLLAQSVEMDYDATIAEIYKQAEDFDFKVTKEIEI